MSPNPPNIPLLPTAPDHAGPIAPRSRLTRSRLTPRRIPRWIAALSIAALPIAAAPYAAADPVWPVAGGEPADATLQDLQSQGYTVQINWVTGYPTVPLSECWVDDIHNPDGPPTPKDPLAIVYVDIGCPSNNFD